MALFVSTPSIADLIQPFLGRTYDPDIGCWLLVRDLLHAGGFVEADVTQADVVGIVQEVWVRGDPRDVLRLTQPWDLWLMRRADVWVEHVGLVVDQERLAHLATLGPCLDLLRRRRPFLFQVTRLRSLL